MYTKRSLNKVLCLFIIFLWLLPINILAEAAQPGKTLVVGGDFDYAPFEYLDQNHQPTGLASELSRLIAKKLQRPVRIKLTKWAQARKALENDEVDLLQGMALTSSRAKEFHFSIPYAQVSFNIFARSRTKIKTLQDISNATLVMQQGDVSNEFLNLIGFEGKVIEVPTQIDALRLLNKGIYDATILNHTHGLYLVEKYHFSKVKALKEIILPQDLCFASKDPQLIEDVNQILMELSFSQELQKLQNKWLSPYQPKWVVANLFEEQHIRLTLIGFLLLFIAFMAIYIFHRKLAIKRRSMQALLSETQTQNQELTNELTLIKESPILFYKVRLNPLELLYISPSIETYGYSQDEFINSGASFLDTVHPEDIQEMLNKINRYDKKEIVGPNEYRLKDKAGKYHWMLNYSFHTKDSLGQECVYGFYLQNKRGKILEEELIEAKLKTEDAINAKGQFLATLSHEIRTPVNGILSLIEALKQIPMSEDQKELFGLIESSGKNLNELIKDILAFSKMDSGQIKLSVNAFNIKTLSASIVDFYASQRLNEMVDIHLDVEEGLPETLWGDHFKTRQILNNLIQNALKFTSSGWIKLSVNRYTQSKHSCHLLFCVQDTGVGIKAELIDHIFDIYYQTEDSELNPLGGSGLGLAIVKRLTKLLDGILWVESEFEKGSSFYVLIPYELEDPSKQANDSPSTSEDNLLFPMDMLIMQDDPIYRKQLLSTFSSWGLYPDHAQNYEQILQKCEQTSFDCILLEADDFSKELEQFILKLRQQNCPAKIFIGMPVDKVNSVDEYSMMESVEAIAKPINLKELHQKLSVMAEDKKNKIGRKLE